MGSRQDRTTYASKVLVYFPLNMDTVKATSHSTVLHDYEVVSVYISCVGHEMKALYKRDMMQICKMI